jgi:hypothetical protein
MVTVIWSRNRGKTFLEILKLGSFTSLPEGNWTLVSFEHTLVVLGRTKIVHFRLNAVYCSYTNG